MNENVTIDPTPPRLPEEPLAIKKRAPKKWLITSIVLALFVVALASLVYLEYAQAKSEKNKNASLTSSNTSLQKQLTDSQAQVTKLKAAAADDGASTNGTPSVVDLTQSSLGLKVLSTQYVNPAGTVTENGIYLGIRLTLTNSTTQDITVDPLDFTLKDVNGSVYKESGITGATTLPSGWGTSTIQDQTIPSGQSIVGVLMFQPQSKSLTSFTLLNDTAPYPITVTTN